MEQLIKSNCQGLIHQNIQQNKILILISSRCNFYVFNQAKSFEFFHR